MRARIPPRNAARSGGARRRPGRAAVPDIGAMRYRVAPGVTHREIAGQSIVLGTTGVLYTFAGSGGVVWPVIAGGAPLERVMEALAGRYGIAPAQARRDVLAFARQLEAQGLVRRQSTRGRQARA